MIDSYKPITYEEQVELMVTLFKDYDVSVCIESIKNWMACSDFNDVRAYLSNIGVEISHNTIGINISISTVNNDSRWMLRKLELIREHFIGDTHEGENTHLNKSSDIHRDGHREMARKQDSNIREV